MLGWIEGIDAAELWWIKAGAGALVFILVAGAFWWWVPKWQMRSITAGDPKDRADIEDNFRKTIGQALGGIAVLIGAGIAYYGTQQTLDANRQAAQDQLNSQQKASEATQEQAPLALQADRVKAEQADKAAHDLLIAQQVTKGFDLLGDGEIARRLGGIYALESVMNDPQTDRYRVAILEALCAFVRDRTKTYKGYDPPATDIQAALTVIGRPDPGAGRINLSNAHIPQADLLNANLSGADLSYANLFYANLVSANLSGANLQSANLSQAYLGGADLSRARLMGANVISAILTTANLTSAQLGGANLSNAVLLDTNLTGADLSGFGVVAVDRNGAIIGRFPELASIVRQAQLDDACGKDVDGVPPRLKFTPRPCPTRP